MDILSGLMYLLRGCCFPVSLYGHWFVLNNDDIDYDDRKEALSVTFKNQRTNECLADLGLEVVIV